MRKPQISLAYHNKHLFLTHLLRQGLQGRSTCLLLPAQRDEEATTPGDLPLSGKEKQEGELNNEISCKQQASHPWFTTGQSESQGKPDPGWRCLFCREELPATWQWAATTILLEVMEPMQGNNDKPSTNVCLLYYTLRSPQKFVSRIYPYFSFS